MTLTMVCGIIILKKFDALFADSREIKMSSDFELLGSRALTLPTGITTDLNVYRHRKSGFNVVFVPVDGPLASATVVVPTLSVNHAGLAHTLEHLIFCGSEKYVNRGYLDTIALRALSTGTNAYTCEDHTGYTVVTASGQGMSAVLPVFVDHIFRPTLRPLQFLTEVCHIDGHGKYQGVVFCEMASRENSEADLLDLALRTLTFNTEFEQRFRASNKDATGSLPFDILRRYAFECGGRTLHIKDLTNDMIKKYHETFYRPDSTTLVLTGVADIEQVLTSLANEECLKHPAVRPNSESPFTGELWTASKSTDIDQLLSRESHLKASADWDGMALRKVIHFPSSDDSIGSFGVAWRGPPIHDLKTYIAIEVLFRYLHDTSASPLYQTFVDGPFMLADDVDFELKVFMDSWIVLIFSGVPLDKLSDEDPDDGSEGDSMCSDSGEENDGTDDSSSRESQGSQDDPIDWTSEETIAKSLHEVLFNLLQNLRTNGLPKGTIHACIQRHKVKYLEAFEDDPYAMITAFLVPQLLEDIYASKWRQGTPSFNDESLGSRFHFMSILEELETQEDEFWFELMDKWLLKAPVAEVLMAPDPKLARKITTTEEKELKYRVKKLGKKGLKEKADLLIRALEDNKINIPEHLLMEMPSTSVIDVSALYINSYLGCFDDAKLQSDCVFRIDQLDGYLGQLFKQAQFVAVPTSFARVKLAFDLSDMPIDLKRFLVLFQELLFQCPLKMDNHEKETAYGRASQIGFESTPESADLFDYRALAKLLSYDLVGYESAVGFGNDLFSCNWLGEVFIMQGQRTISKQSRSGTGFPFPSHITDGDDSLLLFAWFIRVLFETEFTKDRVFTICKTLLNNLTELKRDGSDMLNNLVTRSISAQNNYTSITDFSLKSIDMDLILSPFVQDGFLKWCLETIKNGEFSVLLDKLEALRVYLISNLGSYSFLQVSSPPGRAGSFNTTASQIVQHFQQSKSRPSKRPKTEGTVAFPFPRHPFHFNTHQDHTAFFMSIPGITSSYLTQIVQADVLRHAEAGSTLDEHHPDFGPLICLTALLTRSEGPIYSVVRGKGYGYDAGLSLYLWSGQLVFQVTESSEPIKALEGFWGVLGKWRNAPLSCWEWENESADNLITRSDLDAAVATLLYRSAAQQATPEGLIDTCLKCAIQVLHINIKN